MNFKQWINEANNKMMQYLQSLVPNWPPYVVSDLLYKGYSHHREPSQAQDFLKELATENGYNNANEIQWTLEDIIVKEDIWDDRTLMMMRERGMGKYNPYEVSKDKERHQGAKERMQRNPNIKIPGYAGPASAEPIIVIKWPNGKYELFEGWHRTMQTMLAHPEGYKQKAYILHSKKT